MATDRDTCGVGHDLRKPGSRYPDGRCRQCKHAYMRAVKSGEIEPKRGMRKRRPTCRYGHDTSQPDSRTAAGMCKMCRLARKTRRVTQAKNLKMPKVAAKRGQSPDIVAAQINNRLLQISEELDLAPGWRADELRAEMAKLVRRKDRVLQGVPCDS